MRSKTLFGRITLYLLLLFAISLALFYFIVLDAHNSFQAIATQQVNRDLARNIVIDKKLGRDLAIKEKAWKKVLQSAMVTNPMIDLYFTDPHGRILNYALHREQVVRDHIDIRPIKQFLAPHSMLPVYGDNPRSRTGKKMFSAAPMIKNNKTIGYLYIILNHNENGYQPRLLPQFLLFKSTFLTITIVLLFLLTSSLLIFKLIFRRVEALSHTMQEFQKTQFSRLPNVEANNPQRPDEVDKLGQVFNELAALAQERMQKLNQQDSLRRDLVSQICHDIRTPLTSLNGNLETLLLRGNTMDQKQIRQFLQVSAEQGRVIVNLVDDLFLLSRLDDPEYQPNQEDFCIHELIQDTAEKYSIQLADRGLRLTLDAPEHFVYINADIRMIQRLLDNLLQNAIHYTPRGGRVTLKTEHDKTHLRLMIENESPGIKEQDLERIFDKFFRSRHSLPVDSEPQAKSGQQGSGLGLAICKRIVESHHGIIIAQNIPPNSVRFVITLPMSSTTPLTISHNNNSLAM